MPKGVHTDEFPVLQIPTSMDRDPREDIEARRCTVEDIVSWHVYATRVGMKAREDGIGECSIG